MVKLPTKGKVISQGSFGLPPEVQDAVSAAEAKKSKPVEENPQPQVDEDGWQEPPAAPEKPVDPEEEALADLADPMKRLENIGIELTEDDFHQYLFKGFIQKEVSVVKGLKKDMTAALKTLTAAEYMVVDRLLARIIDTKQSLTKQGFEHQRNIYTLAFGVAELAGKPIFRKDADMTLEDCAEAGAKVINALAAGVINKLIKMHMILTVSMNILVDKGDSPFLSNG